MNQGFEYLIDFVVNLKSDPTKIKKFSSDIAKQLTDINIGVNLSEAQVKKELESILTALSKLDVETIDLDVDFSSALKEVETLSNAFKQDNFDGLTEAIGDLDLSKLSNLKDDLDFDLNSEEFKEFNDFFNQLGNQTDDVKSFADNIADLEQSLSGASPEEFSKAMDDFVGSVIQAETELKTLIDRNKKALEVLKANGNEGSEAYKKLEQDIENAENELKKFGDTSSKVEQQTTSITDKLAKTGLAFQGLTAITGTFDQFIEPFKEFDLQLKNIGTLGVQNFEEFRNGAIDLAASVPDTVAGVTAGLYNAISAGAVEVVDGVANIEQGLEFVGSASKLAVAGLTDTNAAVKGLAAITNAYGRENLSTAEASDQLFGAVVNGVTTIEELNGSLSNVVPIAAAAGVNFDQVSAAIATLTKQGVPTAQATTQMRAAIAELLKPGANLKKVMEEAGVSLESLKQDGLQETMRKLGDGMNTLGIDAANTFSSIEAVGFALATTGKNADKASADLEAIKNSVGSVSNAFEIANTGIGVTVQGILNQVEATAFKLFGTIGDGATAFIDATNKLAPTIFSFAQLGSIIPTGSIQKFTTSLQSMNLEFSKSGLVNAYSKSLNSIKGGASSIGGSMKGLLPLLTNPFVLGGAALTLFLTQTDKGNEILDKMGEKGKALLEKFEPLANFLGNVLGVVIEGVGDVIFGLVDTIGLLIESSIEISSAFYDAIGVTSLFGESLDASTEMGGGVIEFLKTLFEYITLLPTGFNIVIKAFTGIITNLPTIIGAFVDYAKEALNPANWFGDNDNIEKAKKKLGEAMSNALSGAKEEINNFTLGDSLEKALETGDKIKNLEAVDNLVNQFENAKTEIEKNNIAEAIAKDFPQAVKGYKLVEDANGELVKVLDINIDKVKELSEQQSQTFGKDLTEQQNRFKDAVLDQADAYEKLRTDSKNLASEIAELGKSDGNEQRILELKENYDKVQSELLKKSEEVSASLSEANKIGVSFGEVTLPPNFENDFANELLKLEETANDIEIGKRITESVQIQDKIDKNNEIGKLVKEYNEASTDIEKESIAKKLQKEAPELVKATGAVVNKNGQLIKTYEVAGDKVAQYTKEKENSLRSELSSKQEEIIKGIRNEGSEYDSIIEKVRLKQKEIDEAIKKGIDTTELEKEFNALTAKAETSKKAIVSSFAQTSKAGVDTGKTFAEMAKKLNLSEEELKKMVDLQNESLDKAKEQKEEIADLAESWKKVNSALDESINKQVDQLSELRRQRQETNLTKEQKEELIKKEEELLKNTRDLVKQQKNLDSINERVLIQAGLKEVKGKTAFELAKEEAAKAQTALEIREKEFEISQNKLILNKEIATEEIASLNLLAEQNRTISDQRQAWVDILKQRKLITDYNEENGEITFNSRIKEADKTEIQKILQDLNLQLLDNQDKVDKIIVGIEKDDEQIRKEIAELNKERIQWQLELTLDKDQLYKNNIDNIKNSLVEVNKLLDGFNKQELELQNDKEEKILKLGEDASKAELQSIEVEYKQRLTLLKKKENEQLKAQLDYTKQLREAEDEFYNYKLETVKEYTDKIIEASQKEYDEALASFQYLNDLIGATRDEEAEKSQNKELARIDAAEKKKLDKLEKSLATSAKSIEQVEREKTEILENAEKERLRIREEYSNEAIRIQQRLDGEFVAIANESALNEATARKEGAEESLKIIQQKLKDQKKTVDIKEIQDLQEKALEAEKKLELNRYDEKAKLEKENSEKLIQEKLKGLDKEDKANIEALTKQFANAQLVIEDKSSLLNQSLAIFEGSMQEGLAGIFAGDEKALEDSFKGFLQTLAGFLKKKLEGFVLNLVLSPGVVNFVGAIPPPGNILAMTGITLAIRSAINAIADPIFKNLLSFASGGRVDSPTLAVVGDGAKLGSSNREWIFRDEQLKDTVMMASEYASLETNKKLDNIYYALESLNIETFIRGEDIALVFRKAGSKSFGRTPY